MPPTPVYYNLDIEVFVQVHNPDTGETRFAFWRYPCPLRLRKEHVDIDGNLSKRGIEVSGIEAVAAPRGKDDRTKRKIYNARIVKRETPLRDLLNP